MSTRIITIPADESQPSTATTSKADTDTLATIIGHPVKAVEAETLRIWIDTAIAAQPSTLNPRATKLAHSTGALDLQDCINGTAVVADITAETNSGADAVDSLLAELNTIPTPAECPHERPYWFSGEPGVHIPLNGEAALRCLDCGEYGYLD